MSTGSHQSNDLSPTNKSIPELITFLKHAIKESHFKEVERILVEREEKAQLEIDKLRIENAVLSKKCEVLSLDYGGGFSVTNGEGNGGGEKGRSAEEIYNQLVGEIVGGKGRKESDEVGKLKRENEELKRKNVKLRKLVLECVENYVEWTSKFSSLQRDVTKLKTVEEVGLDGISKNRSGENFMQNDGNGLSFGNVCRELDFDVEDNFKQTENMVDQCSRTAPVKSAVEIIDIDDDLPRASCEGTSQKPIYEEHFNQNHASKGQKRKGYSYTNVADIGQDSNLNSRCDIQTDEENVNKHEESTQKVRSRQKVLLSTTSTPAPCVSDAEKVAGMLQNNVVPPRQCDWRNFKQRCISEQQKRSISGVARTYDSKDSSCGDLSADRPKKTRPWKLLENMCADFSIDKICMSAVCTLYRQHQRARKDIDGSTRWGFNSYCLERGMQLAEFLIDGDSKSRLRRTEKELQSVLKKGLEDCRYIAKEHGRQLFEIYQKKVDAYYPDG